MYRKEKNVIPWKDFIKPLGMGVFGLLMILFCSILYFFEIHEGPIIILLIPFLAGILCIAMAIINMMMSYKSVNDPNSAAYYFDRYDLSTPEKAFKIINDPNINIEHREKISQLYGLLDHFNSKNDGN